MADDDACPDATAASDALVAALDGPKRVSSDSGSVEQFGLKELEDADRYLRAKCAGRSRNRGLRFSRLVPDGTAGNC